MLLAEALLSFIWENEIDDPIVHNKAASFALDSENSEFCRFLIFRGNISPIKLADRAVESNSKELSLVVFSHPGFLSTRYWSYVRENPELQRLFLDVFESKEEAWSMFHGDAKISQKDLEEFVETWESRSKKGATTSKIPEMKTAKARDEEPTSQERNNVKPRRPVRRNASIRATFCSILP